MAWRLSFYNHPEKFVHLRIRNWIKTTSGILMFVMSATLTATTLSTPPATPCNQKTSCDRLVYLRTARRYKYIAKDYLLAMNFPDHFFIFVKFFNFYKDLVTSKYLFVNYLFTKHACCTSRCALSQSFPVTIHAGVEASRLSHSERVTCRSS